MKTIRVWRLWTARTLFNIILIHPGDVLYRYVPKDNILFYDKKNRKVYVRYDLIWVFFENYLGLDDQEIKGITEEWLNEAYNLKEITA